MPRPKNAAHPAPIPADAVKELMAAANLNAESVAYRMGLARSTAYRFARDGVTHSLAQDFLEATQRPATDAERKASRALFRQFKGGY